MDDLDKLIFEVEQLNPKVHFISEGNRIASQSKKTYTLDEVKKMGKEGGKERSNRYITSAIYNLELALSKKEDDDRVKYVKEALKYLDLVKLYSPFNC